MLAIVVKINVVFVIKISIRSNSSKVVLFSRGDSTTSRFSVSGPICESSYVEQVLIDSFGCLDISPSDLFDFLQSNSQISDHFQSPILEYGTLQPLVFNQSESIFRDLSLGQKLIKAGFIDQSLLDYCLSQYQANAHKMKFGEYLKINLIVPPALLDLFLDPPKSKDLSFDDMRIGTKLLNLGIISTAQLEEALNFQLNSSKRIGFCMVELGFLSQQQLDFFLDFQLSDL